MHLEIGHDQSRLDVCNAVVTRSIGPTGGE
jgi:hypothetical protein